MAKVSGRSLAKANKMLRRRWAKRRLNKYKRYNNKTGKGYLKLIRKLPEIAIYNSAAGVATLIDPTSSCVNITNLGLSTGATANLYDIAFGLRFRLDQIINSTDVTTLADKYKIKSAYVRLYYNNSNSSTGTQGGMPFVQYITDHDDASAPLSANTLREKMDVKFKTFQNGSSYIGIKVNPKPVREVYATGVLTGFEQPNRSVWLDCANPNVEHYGIRGVFSQVYLPAPAAAQSIFKIDVAIVLEAKDFQ